MLSGQIDFSLVFVGLGWLLGAQTDLYPLLPNVVVVVGCVDGSCRRDRHLLGHGSGCITQCIVSLISTNQLTVSLAWESVAFTMRMVVVTHDVTATLE